MYACAYGLYAKKVVPSFVHPVRSVFRRRNTDRYIVKKLKCVRDERMNASKKSRMNEQTNKCLSRTDDLTNRGDDRTKLRA